MEIKSINQWKLIQEARTVQAYNQWHQQALDILQWSKQEWRSKSVFKPILLNIVEDWFQNLVRESDLTEIDIIKHCDLCLNNITANRTDIIKAEFDKHSKDINSEIDELEQQKAELFKYMELEAGIKPNWSDSDADRYSVEIEKIERKIRNKESEKNIILELLTTDFDREYQWIESYLYQSDQTSTIVESMETISDVFYHGTKNMELGEKIIADGYLKPGVTDTKRGSKFTPKAGMVYLTPKVEEAAVYAIGANILGNDIWKQLVEKEGQFGYVFVINRSTIANSSIFADEDYIGQAIYHLANDEYYDTGFGKAIKGFAYKNELLHTAKYGLTELQYKKVVSYNDYGDFAIAGKKLMFKLPKYIHLELIKLGSPCAVEGNVIISEAWKIDKERCKDLRKDGSNFFEIAEKVNL